MNNEQQATNHLSGYLTAPFGIKNHDQYYEQLTTKAPLWILQGSFFNQTDLWSAVTGKSELVV